MGHIPPVVDSFDFADLWQPAYAASYWAVVQRHSEVVARRLSFCTINCRTMVYFSQMPVDERDTAMTTGGGRTVLRPPSQR